MGNKNSTEDEEYESMYQEKQEGSSKRFITEYEGLLLNDKLKTGARLPVEYNQEEDWFLIEVKKGKIFQN